MTGVALALAASAIFALGTVLQHRAAAATPDAQAGAGLLLRLARRPVWLAGMAADAVGFVCHAAALGAGRLVIVQPLLATSLVFALPLGAALDRRRVTGRELRAALVVTAGLAAFAAAGVVAGAASLLARGATPRRRAVLLGSGAGVLFGLSAALTKATVEQLDDGVLAVFEHWQLYALVVVGYVSMTLSQASLQAGALAPAVATQMALDPVASLFLGVLAFDETIHDDTGALLAALAAFAVMIGGIAFLALRRPAAR